MLQIQHLAVSIDDKLILKDLNLEINPGEVHAIMGPNGSGKSTMASTLAGRDTYQVQCGQVQFLGQDLLDMDPDVRSR